MPRTKRTTTPPTDTPKRGRGQPSALARKFDNRTVGEAILDELRGGEYLETACAYVGITPETARAALRTAALLRLANLGTDPNPTGLTTHERLCLDFSAGYTRANAEYERDVLQTIDEIGRGGKQVRRMRRKRRFVNSEDSEGFVVEQIEEVRDLPPDPQALIWRLAHRFPKRYSPKLHIIDVPADGELDPDDHARELVAGIEGFLQGRGDGARNP